MVVDLEWRFLGWVRPDWEVGNVSVLRSAAVTIP